MAQAVVEFEDDLQSFMYKLVQALHCVRILTVEN